jgi:hypothetical protein
MATLVAPPAHFIFNILFFKCDSTRQFGNPVLLLGDGDVSIFLARFRLKIEVITVIRKISLALVLMTMAGVASAADQGSGGQCLQILWFPPICFAPTPSSPPSVKAPEIDPASAMAGLTMLAGGLAVLRGRRRIKSKE